MVRIPAISAVPSHTDIPAGFRASIGTLDSASAHLPKDGPLVIVTASFEGQPADNAAHFVEWLTNTEGDALAGIKYAIFGCGNREWVKTYQRVPTLIDETFAEHGATRLVERGEGDAGGPEFFEAFDTWEDALWKKLSSTYATTSNAEAAGLNLKVVSPGTARASVLRQPDTALGTVVQNTLLTSPNAPPKRHIGASTTQSIASVRSPILPLQSSPCLRARPTGLETTLPCQFALGWKRSAILTKFISLPVNPERIVRRALARFEMSAEQEVSPSNTPCRTRRS